MLNHTNQKDIIKCFCSYNLMPRLALSLYAQIFFFFTLGLTCSTSGTKNSFVNFSVMSSTNSIIYSEKYGLYLGKL